MDHSTLFTLGIAGIATLGVIVRPWSIPEYIWAVLGAVVLVVAGVLPWRNAVAAAGKGTDVYLFLIGMMLLAEAARREGLFDWLAAHAVRAARGSARRLFVIVYAVGTLTTIFLSNDATAVVLTPAVHAAATAARVAPLPYLLICAFVANAASFVLPISNPANLVIFGAQMPPLMQWLSLFALPSIAAILITFVALRWTQRHALEQPVHNDVALQPLSLTGHCVGAAIAATGIVLLAASAFDRPLGLPTFLCGIGATIAVLLIGRRSPLPVLRDVAWGVLPLVAGLFILVEAVEQTGVLHTLAEYLRNTAATSPHQTTFVSGIIVALLSNLMNNLPTGLLAATVGQSVNLPLHVTGGLLIGVDLGPNLSVTGSLATILWLIALRREGLSIAAWQFLRLGIVVMPPALLAALLVLSLSPH
ncbi:MAG: arsenic transporter [Rhizobiales bacterium]|nr:arsenic transporter [Hyphomicrobiales bacterium]